jgi:hypothetical protein
MTAQVLVTTLSQQGFTLTPLAGNKIEIHPASRLTPELRESLKQHTAAIVAVLTRPHINARGELIIPFASDLRYHWWAGGQSIYQTLRELDAPPEVFARYIESDSLEVRGVGH